MSRVDDFCNTKLRYFRSTHSFIIHLFDKISLCNPDWPKILYVDQAGLKLQGSTSLPLEC